MATDRGDPALSSSVLVTVVVDDVNEFAPEFQFSEEDFPDGEYRVETLSTARAGRLNIYFNPISLTPLRLYLTSLRLYKALNPVL